MLSDILYVYQFLDSTWYIDFDGRYLRSMIMKLGSQGCYRSTGYAYSS
jgi:hypothetical protein